jgi:large subunit ribosomal protein L30
MTQKKKMLKITQTRSLIGSQREKHRNVMKSLGFRKNQQTLYKNDTTQIRGMIQKVRHLVECEEINATDVPVPRERSAGFTIIEGKKAGGTKRTKKRTAEKAKTVKKAKAAKKSVKAKTAKKTK